MLAKVKRLRKNPYKKLLSDVTLYPTLSMTSISTVTYDPDHNLDEDAWFAISEFSKSDFFLAELDADLDAKDYDALKKPQFEDISCLLSIQSKNFYFQKVTPSSFLKRKMIQFGEAANLEASTDRIIVKDHPSAIFIKSDDTLLFKDIASISSIFKGIDQLYKEATESEVKEFLKSDFIKLADGYDHSSVSKPNRKRLSLVIDTMKTMSKSQRENLIEYIKGYCEDGVTLTEDGTSFELSTDTQLKLVLYGIEERFYTTQHSNQKRLANSIEPIG